MVFALSYILISITNTGTAFTQTHSYTSSLKLFENIREDEVFTIAIENTLKCAYSKVLGQRILIGYKCNLSYPITCSYDMIKD